MTLLEQAQAKALARLERQRQAEVARHKRTTLRGTQTAPIPPLGQISEPPAKPAEIQPQPQQSPGPKPDDLKLWFSIQRALFSGPNPETQELTVEELSKLLREGPSGRSLSNALVRLAECYPDRISRKKDGIGRRLWVFPRPPMPPLRRSPFLAGTKNITAP
jgi:hypothetical protein